MRRHSRSGGMGLSYSDQPSIVVEEDGVKIRCGDKVITIRPCGPKSERGPDGDYPYIEVESTARPSKTGFPLSSKQKFEVLYDDLWRLSQ